jgi:malate/lactate dehydrogenase
MVLVDYNNNKAESDDMDLSQGGLFFVSPIKIYAGD